MAVRHKGSGDEEKPLLRSGQTRRQHRPRFFRKLVPLLIMSFVGLLIAKNEVPAVNTWWEKTFTPELWSAKQTCQQAAIADSINPGFARVLEPGLVHETADGRYIERLVIGEMGENGTETTAEYSCYLDGEGRLFRLNRLSKNASEDR
jgi:hypothetical protein